MKKLSVFGKSASCHSSNFLNLIHFQALIIFLGPTLKLVTEINDLQKE